MMQDPQVLARAMPGCESLEKIGENEYRMKMKMALAALSGAFDGKVRITDQMPPSSFRLEVEGSGKVGFRKRRRRADVETIRSFDRGCLPGRRTSGRDHCRRRPAADRRHREKHDQEVLREPGENPAPLLTAHLPQHHKCAKRGTGSNFAAFAKVRACTLFCPVPNPAVRNRALNPAKSCEVCKKGDWLEFRRFCESSCLYPFLRRPEFCCSK